MKIEVLGSGCPACHKLFELTKEAVADLDLKDGVEYITDIQKIIEMGVMQVPVLAIDGKPVMTGATDDIEKVKSLLTDHGNIEKPGAGNGSGCTCGGNC
jgi:small redox-active disulfide protein 2